MIELTTCEDVLKKLYSVQNTDNTNVVCVPEQNVKTTKQKDPEKENISNSNNVEDIQNEKNSLQTTNKSNVESNMNLDNTDYKNLSTSDKIEKSESQKSKDSSNNIEENTDFYTNISENGKHDKYLDGESDNDVKTSQNINTENINGSTALNISKEAKTCTNESDAEVDYAENVEYINIPDDNEGSSSEMILPDSADEQEESGEHAVTNEFIKNNNLSEGNADSATAEEISENVKKVEDEASQDLVAEEPELIAVAENNEENFNSAGTLAEDITDDPLNANISKTNDTATMGAVNDINLKLNKADEDDDEVEVIETRNSPICIESDSDDGEIINSQQTITTKPTPSVINNPRPARTFARKSTATPSHVSNTIPEIQVQPKNFSYLQNQPVLSHRKRTSASASVVTIELSDSSDEESQKSKKSRTNFSTTNFVSPTKRRLLPLSVNKTKHPNSSKSPYLHTNSSKPDMFNTKTLKKCSSTIPQPIYVATPQSKFLQAVNLQPITSGQNPQAFSAQLSNKNVIIPNAFYGNPPAIRSIGNNSEGNSKGKQYTSVLSDSFGVNYTLELVYVRWLENFLHNFCSPQQIATPIALGLLQRVLKNKHFAKMVEIRQNLNNRPSKKDETISANLLVELRGLLLSNSKQLTGAGRALCEAACFYKGSKQTVALTTHRHNGTVGCRTKTIEEVQKEIQTFVGSKPISSTISSQPQEYSLTLTGSTRKRQNDDKEYTPNKSLNSSENLGERKSLRSTRGRKVVDKVFTYNEDELVDFDDSDDDSEEAVQRRIEQKRMQVRM